MAQNFKVDTLYLTKNKVRTSGNSLYVNDILVVGGGGGSGVSSLNTLTGNVLIEGTGNASILLYGGKIYVSGNHDDSLNISGSILSTSGALENQIVQSGSYLFNLINAASAGVSSLNGLSGAVSLIGNNHVFISIDGQNIQISGDAWIHGQNNALNLSGNLAQTGANLYQRDLDISGALQALITNAASDVESINSQSGAIQFTGKGNVFISSGGPGLITVSGDTGVYANFSTKTDLYQTGSNLFNRDTSISGGLEARIRATGQASIAYTNFVSGGLNANIRATGNANWNHARNNAINLSGNLGSSGSFLYQRDSDISGALQNLINKADSGVKFINGQSNTIQLTGRGNVFITSGGEGLISISGDTGIYANFATKIALEQTGFSLLGTINSIGSTISGDIGETGAALILRDNSISGGLEARIQVTGAAALLAANLYANGIGSILSGKLTQTGQLAFQYTDVRVQESGQALVGYINSASGNLNSKIAFTGQQNWNHARNNAINLSGDLTQTGVRISNVSGGLQAQINSLPTFLYVNGIGTNLSGNIFQTGSDLQSIINSLSGYIIPFIQNCVYTTGEQEIVGQKIIVNSILSGRTNIPIEQIIQFGQSGSGIILTPYDNNSIGFEGSQGQLFSIANSLTGSLMSVNNIAGLPILEVFDSDKVVLGEFGTNALVVSGSGVSLGSEYVYPNKVLFISGDTRYEGHISSGGVNIADLFYPRDNPSGYISDLPGTGAFATTTYVNGMGANFSGDLTQTGSTLFNRDASISGGLEARIRVTGQSSIVYANAISGGINSNIRATGSANWNHSRNNAINLSGNLFNTGATLSSLINYIGAQSANAVHTTGTEFISGTKYFLQPVYIDSLFVTGTQTVVNTQDVFVGDNWLVLNATGGARDSAIFMSTGLTGALSYGAIIGLDVPSNTWRFGFGNQLTDLVSLPQIGSVEEIEVLEGSLLSLIASTGQQNWNHGRNNAINLSGNLFLTGSSLASAINSVGSTISGNIAQTGTVLNNRVNSVSGWARDGFVSLTGNQTIDGNKTFVGTTYSRNIFFGKIFSLDYGLVIAPTELLVGAGSSFPFINSGFLGYGSSSAETNSTLNWVNKVLSGNWLTNTNSSSSLAIVNNQRLNSVGSTISGNLTQTGQTLFNRDTSISGGLEVRIRATGSANWNHARNNAINLSGNLTQTGSNLDEKINSLSGNTEVFFVNKLTAESITGSKTFVNQLECSQSIICYGGNGFIYNNDYPRVTYWGGSSNIPTIAFDSNDGLRYSQSSNEFQFIVGGTEVATLSSAGTLSSNGSVIVDGVIRAKSTGVSYVSGIFGIGTDAPTEMLHLRNAGSTRIVLEADTDNINESHNPQILLSQDGGLVSGYFGYNDENILTLNIAGGSRGIGLQNSGKYALYVDSVYGNIGVSNTNPLYELDASGRIRSTDGFYSGDQNIADIFANKIELYNTGSNLFNRDSSISGGLEARIRATGSANWNHSRNNAINLSGRLTVTGATLIGKINSLSGWAAPVNANYVHTTGNQTIAGTKNFQSAIISSGEIQLGDANANTWLLRNAAYSVNDRHVGIGVAAYNTLNNQGDYSIFLQSRANNASSKAYYFASRGLYTKDVGVEDYDDLRSGNNANLIFGITSGGNVGVGVSNPTGKFEISSTGTIGNVTSPVLKNASLIIKDQSAYGYFDANSWFTNGSLILSTLSNNYITLATNNSERMRIDSDGNVGIGTTIPNRKFEVQGDRIRFSNASSIGEYGELYDNGSIVYLESSTNPIYVSSPNDIRLHANNSVGGDIYLAAGSAGFIKFRNDSTDRMIINTDGNVGIGTITPSYNLEVNGTFAASSKSFIIPHPLVSGKRLQHGVIEGPSHSVYIVGSTGGKIIELPDYWTRLVDYSTVCVQLTPSGKNQRLYVKEIKDNKVIIENGFFDFKTPNYYYNISAERIDIEKLKVEI